MHFEFIDVQVIHHHQNKKKPLVEILERIISQIYHIATHTIIRKCLNGMQRTNSDVSRRSWPWTNCNTHANETIHQYALPCSGYTVVFFGKFYTTKWIGQPRFLPWIWRKTCGFLINKLTKYISTFCERTHRNFSLFAAIQESLRILEI